MMQAQEQSSKGGDVVRFVQVLTREISGHLLVLWDGASLHRSQAVKETCEQGKLHACISNSCQPLRPNSICGYLNRRHEQPAGKPLLRSIRAF